MKLLTRTTRYYLIFSSVVLLVGGLAFYPILHNIFYRQIDENLHDEKLIIIETIEQSDSVPDFRPVFGHEIEVTILNTPRKKKETIRDTTIYLSEKGAFVRYRNLWIENTSLEGKGYIINLFKPLREAETLLTEIYLAIGGMFIALLLMLVLVNYIISRGVWIPFYRTLGTLRNYNINDETPLKLTESKIREFINLNRALEKMSKKIREDYVSLKEFNEKCRP